ncbi:oxidoreductase [Mycobacterium sp. 236(2023)]|uniref:oxidoreductase n=1 Tax=Mycobacterium sp. 236(2023) TaxID=3038163 RepID=UPI002414D2F2|nr:oxidoreductase [Mycobacterium sp. 236(2023)]MDG4663212.1 oxidoreductase [Mycobacterium sp. 236(2023)]
MDLHLTGKTAVVTGASKGIGLAIAGALVDAGAFVIAGARTCSDELRELEAAGNATFVPVDLAAADQPAQLISAAVERGGLDILVNNVGAATPRPGGFATVTDDEWNATWNLGVMAAVRTTRAAIPELLKSESGSIVMIGSVNAFLPDPALPDYCAIKAALTNLTKGLSKELGPKGIRVNSVSPGPVVTPLWFGDGGVASTFADASGQSPEDVAQSVVENTPLGRFSTPAEVADLVVFLASDRAANITGADMTIDAGMITTVR